MAISSLSAIKDTQKGKSNLFAGDWNMTQHRSDSSGAKDHFASTPALRKEFEDTLDKLGLSEIYQGSHTRVSSHQGSSRLDRFYTSLSLAEKCVVMPETLLPQHPHLPGSASRVSDHFPVSLSFGRQLAKHSRFRIPEWVARHPGFIRLLRIGSSSAGWAFSRQHSFRFNFNKSLIRYCACAQTKI